MFFSKNPTNLFMSIRNKKSLLKILSMSLLLSLISIHAMSQETKTELPDPRVIEPGDDGTPPSDAIILFSRNHLDQFISTDGSSTPWKVQEDIFTVEPGSGNIMTRDHFGDCQLHIEWKTPAEAINEEGQKSGNSGIYLMGKYEIQVLNSYKNKTYPDGQAGAVYRQYPPRVNASRPPGEWQVYDIVFIAPEYNDAGELIHPPLVTVFHNGILIQHSVEIQGPTTAYNQDLPEKTTRGPLMLQDHSSKVSYRNIWIRELEK